MNTSFEQIRLHVDNGIATITLDRPERLNSFTTLMHEELRRAIAIVRDDNAIRVLILTGAGRAFCAGQDLGERKLVKGGDSPDLGKSLEDNYHPLVLSLRSLEKPVIGAINGVAAGAGASLALACDLVIAARSASFIQAFCRLGLVPDAGGTYFLTRSLGAPRAMGLALLGDRLDAQQAEQWGLIWRCVDDTLLMPQVHELATTLANGPTRGYARTKQAIHAAEHQVLEQQLATESQFQRELGRTDDYLEGVSAFREKRKAHFTGK
ncbi:MAG: 2-(1,2-epoxy-1,2-dihydrophenyl)acetyl-CoA isomerase PaaG [Burkholderiales bacterium]|jgi:2-(1,2-epoxy-1,2-dihydrophenyl)acetyl-CoA isomerase